MWILVTATVLALTGVMTRGAWLPEYFDNDAVGIAEIAHGEREAPDRYYQLTANIYDALGVVDQPWLVGMFGVLALAGVVWWLWRWYEMGPVAVGLAVVGILLGSVFLGTLSKDLFELLLVTAVGIGIMHRKWGWAALAGGIMAFGAMWRPYWLIIGGLYLGWLLIWRVMQRKMQAWQILVVALVMVAAAGVGYWVMTGADISAVRVEASGMEEARSAIVNAMAPGSVGSAVVNSVVTLVGLVVPWGLFALGDAYHIVAGLLMMVIWGYFIYWLVRGRTAGKEIAVSLVLAFLVVSCLFEPDYGSWLRHMVPVIPFMIYAYVRPRKEIS
jgi:hypothetical protein